MHQFPCGGRTAGDEMLELGPLARGKRDAEAFRSRTANDDTRLL
jgi:hypothetical protein